MRFTEKNKFGKNELILVQNPSPLEPHQGQWRCDTDAIGRRHIFTGDFVDKLAGYEDLEEQGYLKKFPCKVGDMLYEPTSRGTISTYEVTAIKIELFAIFIEWKIVHGFVYRNMNGVEVGEIGKTVFLTEADAEQALSKMESEAK